jgi:trk system potassium uptake protein TrkH
MFIKNIVHFSPARLVLFLSLVPIAIGTLFLSFSFSQEQHVSLLDCLFMATSATCICGLNTVPWTAFSSVGKMIILTLIQVGGLGLVTLSLFIMSFFMQFGFSTQLMAGKLLDLDSWKNLRSITLFIITLTVLAEGIGSLVNFITFRHLYPLGTALFLAVFHAVSTFCHAGITLFDYSMVGFGNQYLILLSNALLMAISGIGFITWYDIYQSWLERHEEGRYHFSLQTKIVISLSFALLLMSTGLFYILEQHNTLASYSLFGKICNALFNGIGMRGTGLCTVPTEHLQLATLLIMMLMAFIGSAPGSSGSGIKVTTVALLIATIRAAIRGTTSPSIMGRSISKDQMLKAVAIPILAVAWVIIITFCLLITETGFSFLDILFESVSAFATLGLSTGMTPYLSKMGKFFIILNMIIGRIGALGLVLAILKRQNKQEFAYPEERVILG